MLEAVDRRAVQVGARTRRHRPVVVADHAGQGRGLGPGRPDPLTRQQRPRPAALPPPRPPLRPAARAPPGHGWRPRLQRRAPEPAQQQAGVPPQPRGQPGLQSPPGQPPRWSPEPCWPPKQWPANGTRATTLRPHAGQHRRQHPRRQAGEQVPDPRRRAWDGRGPALPQRGVTPQPIQPRATGGAAPMSRLRLPDAARSRRKVRSEIS